MSIQFYNTSTRKYSIILALSSVVLLLCLFAPPPIQKKILNPPLTDIQILILLVLENFNF